MSFRQSAPAGAAGPGRKVTGCPSCRAVRQRRARRVTVTRYGQTASIQAAGITCLWHSVFGTRPVTVVLIRDRTKTGYDLALVTTDTAASPAQVIERYAARWSVEVAIEDSKLIFGAGQARNRTARAVERAIPFQLGCQAITVTWHATAGHHLPDGMGVALAGKYLDRLPRCREADRRDRGSRGRATGGAAGPPRRRTRRSAGPRR